MGVRGKMINYGRRNCGSSASERESIPDTPDRLLQKLKDSYVRQKAAHRTPISSLVIDELADSIASMVAGVSRLTGEPKDYGLITEKEIEHVSVHFSEGDVTLGPTSDLGTGQQHRSDEDRHAYAVRLVQACLADDPFDEKGDGGEERQPEEAEDRDLVREW